jgi:regulator of replication initiation timing
VSKLKLLDQQELEATRAAASTKIDSLRTDHLRLLNRVQELERVVTSKIAEVAAAQAEADKLRSSRGDLVRRLEAAESALASKESG